MGSQTSGKRKTAEVQTEQKQLPCGFSCAGLVTKSAAFIQSDVFF